jgi:hypothetical protein
VLFDVALDSDYARETPGKACYPFRLSSHTLTSGVGPSEEQSVWETKYQNGYLSYSTLIMHANLKNECTYSMCKFDKTFCGFAQSVGDIRSSTLGAKKATLVSSSSRSMIS